MKINVSLADELVVRLDNYAEKNYMSRSGLISLACTQYLNSQQVMDFIRDMSLVMRKIADTGQVDSDTMRQLEDFEMLAKMLIGG